MSDTGSLIEPVDVCLIVEGCYPFITGGVSSWLDWLIRTQPELSFGVVAITADDATRDIKFDLPDNLRFLQELPLATTRDRPSLWQADLSAPYLARDLEAVIGAGNVDAFDRLGNLAATKLRSRLGPLKGRKRAPDIADFVDSPTGWDAMVTCYQSLYPKASFVDFFWAWRNLLGGFFSVLTAEVPPARAYHSISTGYAGLFGAIAATRTGRPFVITEHGIYTNERRIDITLADWIPNEIESGIRLLDDRAGVCDFWVSTFESYARIAYEKASHVTTLYAENQTFQRALGVSESKLVVIPNGIDLSKFGTGKTKENRERPCVALIGRVVPIKDIEAFIVAAGFVRDAHPNVEVLILGPRGEDQAYFKTCKRKVEELGLQDTITFTGRVNIPDYLEKIDVLVLTSISEAQPLVLLEAGAAGIPSVASDVGSCREIIEGLPDEHPKLGLGGRVVPPMAPEATGAAINELLSDDALRRECGSVMKQRVELYFTSEVSARRYTELYDRAFAS